MWNDIVRMKPTFGLIVWTYMPYIYTRCYFLLLFFIFNNSLVFYLFKYSCMFNNVSNKGTIISIKQLSSQRNAMHVHEKEKKKKEGK